MPSVRIALANVRPPANADDSVKIVCDAIAEAAKQQAAIVCFPECIVPGYRLGNGGQPPSREFLERAWQQVDSAAAEHGIAVILGTERLVDDDLRITARISLADGSCAGFQDKVQLDPSEESTYSAGTQREIFRVEELTFGVVICHEGWRYPETVRWAARNGAQVVFHPHFEFIETETPLPRGFADPANTFHEKAALCRAAENTCYFATVNCALPGGTTTSAVIDPQGELVCHQPHGQPGVLVADIELEAATGLLAHRLRSQR